MKRDLYQEGLDQQRERVPVRDWGYWEEGFTFDAGGVAGTPLITMPSADYPGRTRPTAIKAQWLNIQVNAYVSHTGSTYSMQVFGYANATLRDASRDALARSVLGPPWGWGGVIPNWDTAAWIRIPWSAGYLAIEGVCTRLTGATPGGFWSINWWATDD